MRPGDVVKLLTPDNPRLDGALGTVESLTEWGAHVLTSASGSGRFRAMAAEMQLYQAVTGSNVREQGFTGDVCVVCGGMSMIRNGSCLLCTDCGTTSGCS